MNRDFLVTGAAQGLGYEFTRFVSSYVVLVLYIILYQDFNYIGKLLRPVKENRVVLQSWSLHWSQLWLS